MSEAPQIAAGPDPAVEAGAPSAAGRPTAGQALAQSLDEAAQRRGKSRNVRALGHLIPYAAGHRLDTAAAGVFLVTAAGASLGQTWAVRLLVDHLTGGLKSFDAPIRQAPSR